jgi:pyridoxine/pyridoxamine 5'-phosphate oxidase
MLQQLLNDAKQEIKFGYLKKKHPFRYPVLASMEDNIPQQRTVVLRDTTDAFELVFFTDKRSPKIKQLNENSTASLLFYHPKKLLQIKVIGKMHCVEKGEEIDHYWSKVQGNSAKDFSTAKAPGTPIKNPDHVDYLEEQHHFCVLKLKPEVIEYLQLKRPNHIRARFSIHDEWKGDFLTP